MPPVQLMLLQLLLLAGPLRALERQVALHNVSFSVALRQDGSENDLRVGAGEDPVDVVAAFAAAKQLPPIRARYLSRRLQNCVSRQYQPALQSSAAGGEHPIPLNLPGASAPVPLQLRWGDDLWLVAQLFAADHGLAAADAAQLAQSLERRVPQHQSSGWRSVRRDRQAGRPPAAPAAGGGSASASASGIGGEGEMEGLGDCVTLVFTTCKRLPLFRRTARAVLSALGAAAPDAAAAPAAAARPFGPLVCDVLVVDDNSSPADRAAMLREFPAFRFLLKPPHEAGHAVSLNVALRAVGALGDAGAADAPPGSAPPRFALFLEDDWECGGDGSAVAAAVAAAVRILRAANDGTGAAAAAVPPLAQVLLNDQGGGWPAVLPALAAGAPATQLHVHEFGAASPAHRLAWWPGFSLNPAVWDLRRLRQTQGALRLRFNESDDVFEQSFSLAVHDSGLRVAFLGQSWLLQQQQQRQQQQQQGARSLGVLNLSAPLFRHIGGSDVTASAYELNGRTREWDAGGGKRTGSGAGHKKRAGGARRTARRRRWTGLDATDTRPGRGGAGSAQGRWRQRNTQPPLAPLPLFAFQVDVAGGKAPATPGGPAASEKMTLSIRPDQDAAMMSEFFCSQHHVARPACLQVRRKLEQVQLLHDVQDRLVGASFADAFCAAAGIRPRACAAAGSVAELFRQQHLRWSLRDSSSAGEHGGGGGSFESAAHFFRFYGTMHRLAARSGGLASEGARDGAREMGGPPVLPEHLSRFQASPFYRFLTVSAAGLGCSTAACRERPWREALQLAASVNVKLLAAIAPHARGARGLGWVQSAAEAAEEAASAAEAAEARGDGTEAATARHLSGLDALTSQHALLLTLLLDAVRAREDTPWGSLSYIEIGGGWGNMARTVHGAFGLRRWTILDVPEVSELQVWYLNRTVGGAGALVLHNAVEGGAAAAAEEAHGRGPLPAAVLNCVDADHKNTWAAGALGRRGADVLIATHSWSELALDDFYWYAIAVLPKVRFLLYATQLGNGTITAQHVQRKLDTIGEWMEPIAQHKTEGGTVLNVVFARRKPAHSL